MSFAKQQITLRDATRADAELLYQWVNSPDSLANKAATNRAITWQTHTAWLTKRLADPHCVIKIIEQDKPIGQLRLERRDDALDVDIYLTPDSRGHGIAATALSQAFAQAPAQKFRAQVGRDNTASQALFRRLGFSQTSQTHQLSLIELAK